MFKRIYFIALVSNLRFGTRRHTLYLFDKEEKVVLPVEVKNMEALMFLTGKAHLDENVPHLYMFVKGLIEFFGAKLVSVMVFGSNNGVLGAYLNLVVNDEHIKLPLGFIDAFAISRLFDSPLYAHHKVLDDYGIKVSKEILRDALRENL